MRLTKVTQNLLGPLVVGCAFGLLAAAGAYGFPLEYGSSVYADASLPLSVLAIIHGVSAFLVVAGGITVVFGLVPVWLHRLTAQDIDA